MLLKPTALFYFADRTQMAGESWFFPSFDSPHTPCITQAQEADVRTVPRPQSMVRFGDSETCLLMQHFCCLCHFTTYLVTGFLLAKTHFCTRVSQAKPGPPRPVEFEDPSASSVISSIVGVGPLRRIFIHGKAERSSNSPAAFPGPEWYLQPL